ncbi:hypothetical protein TURU_061965 [Turdus rufiventris]|nr:hypothetical protein TURU_061965 [Turdus rufiventris]
MPPSPLGLAVLLLAAAGRSLPVRRAQSSTLRAGIGWRSNVLVMFAKSRNMLPLWLAVTSLQTDLGAEESSDGSLSEVVQKWKEYQLQCQKYLYETPPIVAEGKFCNRTFDDYACWPDGLPGTYVNVSCPWYLPWANAVLKTLDFQMLLKPLLEKAMV